MSIHGRIEALAYNVDIIAGCIADRVVVDGFDEWDRRYWTTAYVEATTNLRDTRALRDDLRAVTA